MQAIHFIGIGGIGVSALAQLAQARGARVSGSDSVIDLEHNAALARLADRGARLFAGHAREHLPSDADLVVSTAAVNDANPEIQEALRRGIRVTSRAAYLGELMDAHAGPTIAVSGTHGKTTTTGFIGAMLQQAGLDPTVFVGAEVADLGGNLRIGSPNGPFVAEACEAYDSFLHLHPDIAVITNIEADHLDHYGDEAGVFAAFAKFAANIRPGGALICCGDDPGVQRLRFDTDDGAGRYKIVYGLNGQDWDFSARLIDYHGAAGFVLHSKEDGGDTREFRLSVFGRHNAANALAALSVGRRLGLSFEAIAQGLERFHGAERRQQILGTVPVSSGRALVVDDYAHHPTEIRATLNALRAAFPQRRVVLVFQPHLFSRTRDFMSDFAHELARADLLYVTDIYPAREAPIPGVTSQELVSCVRSEERGAHAQYAEDRKQLVGSLAASLLADDICVFMGAGDIRMEAEALIAVGTKEQTSVEEAKIAIAGAPRKAAVEPDGAARKLRVAVLMGGTSSERQVSLVSGQMIARALSRESYEVIALDTRDLFQLTSGAPAAAIASAQSGRLSDGLCDPAKTEQMETESLPATYSDGSMRPDVVFIALHGKGGEDGTVQGLLEVMGIPYTGSGVLASALAMDKAMTKRLFESAGIPVIRGVTVYAAALEKAGSEEAKRELERRVDDALGYPVFVKPNSGGSTCGGSLVTGPDALWSAIKEALKFDDAVLVEQYIKGVEITVGVLDTPGEPPTALPVIEIVPKSAFYDYESKYADGGSEHIIPARLSPHIACEAQELSIKCHTLLGCRTVSRTDLIFADGRLYVLEVNTIPGMTPTSLLPQAAEHAGISFEELLDRIIGAALNGK